MYIVVHIALVECVVWEVIKNGQGGPPPFRVVHSIQNSNLISHYTFHSKMEHVCVMFLEALEKGMTSKDKRKFHEGVKARVYIKPNGDLALKERVKVCKNPPVYRP